MNVVRLVVCCSGPCRTVIVRPSSFTDTALKRLAFENANDALDTEVLRAASTSDLLKVAPVKLLILGTLGEAV